MHAGAVTTAATTTTTTTTRTYVGVGVADAHLELFALDDCAQVALLHAGHAELLDVRTRLAQLVVKLVRAVHARVALAQAYVAVDVGVDVHDCVEHLEAVREVVHVEWRLLLLEYELELDKVESARVVAVHVAGGEEAHVVAQYVDKVVARVRHQAAVERPQQLGLFCVQ